MKRLNKVLITILFTCSILTGCGIKEQAVPINKSNASLNTSINSAPSNSFIKSGPFKNLVKVSEETLDGTSDISVSVYADALNGSEYFFIYCDGKITVTPRVTSKGMIVTQEEEKALKAKLQEKFNLNQNTP